MQVETVLIKPLITEKTSVASEKYNRYGFVVNRLASKNQIKEAVESLYDVKVTNVKTNIAPGKVKRTNKGYKKSGQVKKAFVQLKDGQKIEFFKGV